jgi:RNA polymerase sigma-70 factor (ECF subfamily)
MLSEAWQKEIHARLISNDPIAPSELAEIFIEPLSRALQKKFPKVNSDQIADAVTDTLMDYIKAPEKFKPAKRSLKGYLIMSATSDLINAIEKENRKKLHEFPTDNVELHEFGGNVIAKPTNPVTMLVTESLRADIRNQFDNEVDLEMVDLILDGERSTTAFAKILQIENLPIIDQKREVKKHKDRIKKRLRRYGQRIK